MIRRQLRSRRAICCISSALSGSVKVQRRLLKNCGTFTENGIGICPRCTAAHWMQMIAGCTPCFAAMGWTHGSSTGEVSSAVRSPLGAIGGANRAIADGHDAVAHNIVEKLRLLEVRMEFHLVARRFDLRIAQQKPQFRQGQRSMLPICCTRSLVHQLFKLPPGFYVVVMDVRLGIGRTGRNIAFRRMEIGKRPVDQVEIEILQPQLAQRLFAACNNILRRMFVVPELGSNP